MKKIKSVFSISILVLAVFALFAACKNPHGGDSETTYTVTFDKNHSDVTGYTNAAPRTKTVTTPVTTIDALPAAPTRAGYNFTSWNTKADGTGSNFTASTVVKANITVYAQWQEESEPPPGPDTYTIALSISGNVSEDSVVSSPQSGVDGAVITISYTVANDKLHNRLNFLGTKASIDMVASAETGTREYTIDEEDAINGTITIIATFTHTDKEPDNIAFADTAHVNKTYGDAAFTRAVTVTGSGSGAITYSSSDTNVATVNPTTGDVTILKAGTSVITATKTTDSTYEGTTAEYTLNVEKLTLTISGTEVTKTKIYDTTAAAAVTTVGTLNNKINGDDVSVSADATYNSANVAEANSITVEYSISGDDVDNYNKPANLVITDGVSITQATGVTPSEVLTAGTTPTSIIINAVTPPSTGQAVEYGISTTSTTEPDAWADTRVFSGLSINTTYNIFARAKDNGNYTAGTVLSATITTPSPSAIVNFEDDAIGGTYGYTKGSAAQTVGVEVVADPVNAGEKSLSISSNNYNQAVIIPISIKETLSNATSFTFRFLLKTGTISSKQIRVHVAANPSSFADGGFGNSAYDVSRFGNTNSFSTSTLNTWTNYTITPNLGPSVGSLTVGTVYLCIGINHNSGSEAITYLLDDLQFIFPKTAGAAIDGVVTTSDETDDGVTITAALSSANPGNQTIEYAVSGSNASAPASGWQDSNVITGLNSGTSYFAWARAKENDDYNAGIAVSSTQFTTTGESTTPQPLVVDFSDAGMFKSIGTTTLVANTTSSYTFQHGNWDVARVFTITLPAGMSLASYGTITFTLEGTAGSDFGSKTIRVKGGKPLSTVGDNDTNNIGTASPSSTGSSISIGGTPLPITVTIPNNSTNQGLDGAIDLTVFIRATSPTWRVSNFTLNPRNP